MHLMRITEALAKVTDALDEQALEIRLFQRNLTDLRFELADLKASLLEYDASLDRTKAAARQLGDTQRDLIVRL